MPADERKPKKDIQPENLKKIAHKANKRRDFSRLYQNGSIAPKAGTQDSIKPQQEGGKV